MTEISREMRTEELLSRSRRLREELASMLLELEDYVHQLDRFVVSNNATPEERK